MKIELHSFFLVFFIPFSVFTVFIDIEALMDEAKSMITVGKYNENIVNLQGVCFDMPDGRNLENVRTMCNYF